MKFSDVRQFLLRQKSAENLIPDERKKLASFLRTVYRAAGRDMGNDESNRSRILLVAFQGSSVICCDINNDRDRIPCEGVSQAFRIVVGYKSVYQRERYPTAKIALIPVHEGRPDLDSSL